MTDVMVFVLHAKADEAYASAIAESLTSARAMAVNYDAAVNMRFGRGSICLALCTRALGALEGAERALGATSDLNAAMCQIGDAPLSSLAARARVVRLSGDVTVDAGVFSRVVAEIDNTLRSTMAQRTERRAAAPSLAAHGGPADPIDPAKADTNRAQGLALRSASGVALTLAVVAAVVPTIGQRAMATDTGADPTMDNAMAADNALPAEADEVALPSQNGALLQTTAVASPTPHLDLWLGEGASEPLAPLGSVVVANEADLIEMPAYEMLAPLPIANDMVLALPSDRKADLAGDETRRSVGATAPSKPKTTTASRDA